MSANGKKIPQLRGGAKRSWGMALLTGLTLSAGVALWCKTNIVEARKKHYADFYENYDDDKEYEAMKKAGVFKGFESAA